MTHSRKLLLLLALAMLSPRARGQIIINELMQSNIDCIMDDLNEFPDSWVELYNGGENAVTLAGYSIADTDDATAAWQLPDVVVPARSYALVYCDKQSTGMHAHFRIDSGKGAAVYLFKNGTLADHVEGLKKQPAPNTAYGRHTDGSSDWGYQATPTPGLANCGQLCSGVLGAPVFSEKGKVMTSQRTISLRLSLPEGAPEGTEIRYTTNGSEPTRTSMLYNAPISISQTRTVRAKLFCNGWLSPRSTTHSYIFFPHQLTLPVVSIVTDSKYLNDKNIGIYVNGSYQSGKNNYEFNWRRPVNLEYFEAGNQESDLNQLCETRIQGGASRGSALKSMVVYANKRFGTKRLKYEFFPDQRPGITDYKSILLRNAGNDFDYLYMRDAVIQRTMAAHTDLDWQAWRPVVVYINGVYKGMLNIRERSTADNIYTNYNGLEDIDMIENWNELKEGDTENYDRFKQFYGESGHTLAEYEQWMDWREFINLMLMNLYYNNQDFPGNNIVMWRPRTEGGLWRFVAKDTDFGLGLYGSSASYNSIEWIYNPNYDSNRSWANQYEHTRLFRRLMADADFKRELIDRAAVYMGDFMNEKGTRAVWDPMYETIKTEYPYHRELINRWWPNYSSELNSARQWLSQRTNNFYQHLANYYKLGTPCPLTVNGNLSSDEAEALQTSINGIALSRGTFSGKFFANRQVTLSGTAPEGKEVTGWKVTRTENSGLTQTTEVQGSTYTFMMPACRQLAVNAVVGEDCGIKNVERSGWTWKMTGSELLITGVEARTRISLYDMQGMVRYQTVARGGDIHIPLAATRQLYILKVGNETLKF